MSSCVELVATRSPCPPRRTSRWPAWRTLLSGTRVLSQPPRLLPPLLHPHSAGRASCLLLRAPPVLSQGARRSSVSVLFCLSLSHFCLEPKGSGRGIRAYRAKPEHREPGGEAPLSPSSARAAPGHLAVPRCPSSPGSSVTRQESAGFNPVGWVKCIHDISVEEPHGRATSHPFFFVFNSWALKSGLPPLELVSSHISYIFLRT